MVAAKLVGALGLGLVVFATWLTLAALSSLAVIWFRGASNVWNVNWTGLAGLALVLLLGIAMGVGFGSLLLSTPAAIVAYYTLPTALTIAVELIPGLAGAANWIDTGNATLPLLQYESMDRLAWAQLAAASAIWIGLPLSLGAWRVVRREVK